MAVVPKIVVDVHQLPKARTEEWRRSEAHDGEIRNLTAHVEVLEGEYVLVSYPLLAQMLTLLGYARVDHIDSDDGGPHT